MRDIQIDRQRKRRRDKLRERGKERHRGYIDKKRKGDRQS